MRRYKILHVITGLQTGGAEMMLNKLLSATNKELFEPVVISLIDKGTLGERIEALGIPLYTIGMKSGMPTPASIWRFIWLVRQLHPDLIQGWMTHGNLAAQLASSFILGGVPVLWNIRHSALSRGDASTSGLLLVKQLSYFCRLPAKIIYNSQVGAQDHHRIGYCADKTIVIPNGFDSQRLSPSVEARESVRAELQFSENTRLIGLIARFHAMKDHNTFLQAAAMLSKKYLDVQFVLVGRGVDGENPVLCNTIKERDLGKRVHLLGERSDIPRLLAALDIATSSSYSEGFPNVIGEAMSCGVPCVVTDVGDSAWIVGDTGKIVPPRNPAVLSEAWEVLIELEPLERRNLGLKARGRIKEFFSIEKIVEKYERVYQEVIHDQY